MKRVRWLGLAVIATIVAVFGLYRLDPPWSDLLIGLALLLSCVSLFQEVRRRRA
jgi:hypothetical protein